ncbi:dihydrouridine synthase [Cephaloticoccus capnophilus]|uniref:tRNA-dihydrouridine synthase n=1 Tax=Cephaloticoccus capnophilus TaxID=1548208 RepID=A0A139SU21_9BACT|nr:tRNA-dihydrouridine synthase [Cephaloticoccus capnophilus]KXU37960.1 dihydrouridine synthase [Cephaloticoccus capnophilus]
MSQLPKLPSGHILGQPLTALAPMQDVTDLAFMRVIAHYGAPDYFFTEFFRVHSQSRPEKHILRSIDENDTGRPIFAQLIGEDTPQLIRTVRELRTHAIAGIDLNLGCPAPKVYKKNVGGGLLRDPQRIAELLAALRDACGSDCPFTVKMRIGFEDTAHFNTILDSVSQHRVDLLSVHGRTVREGYRSEVHYDFIAHAAARVPCPVLANGNITSATKARDVLTATGSAGVMIGRHAIRNPWIFSQCRDTLADREPPPVVLAQVRDYIERLYEATRSADFPERAHVNKMKKYLNFVGQSVDPAGAFLHAIRRASTATELFQICDTHLLSEPGKPFSDEPYPGVIARPNCETPQSDGCSLETVAA